MEEIILPVTTNYSSTLSKELVDILNSFKVKWEKAYRGGGLYADNNVCVCTITSKYAYLC